MLITDDVRRNKKESSELLTPTPFDRTQSGINKAIENKFNFFIVHILLFLNNWLTICTDVLSLKLVACDS